MKIDVIVEMGLDAASEEALEVVWKASQILLQRYGIKAFVIPSISWGQDLTAPRIRVCGRTIELFPTPNIMEVVDLILSLLPCTQAEEHIGTVYGSIERPVFKACA